MRHADLKGRRRFLGGCIGACGLTLGGEVACALFRYVAPPGPGEAEPVRVPLEEISAGGSVEVRYGAAPVMIFDRGGGEFVALDLTCTHLGCIVKWRARQDLFECPCHEGFFNADGSVRSGPPPLALQPVPFRIEGGTMVVGEEP